VAHRRIKYPDRHRGRFSGPFTKPVAAVIEDKTGRRVIRAKYFVDASGDGDLVARAGLPTRRDSEIQPPTTCAILLGLGEVAKRNQGFSLDREVFNSQYPNALANGILWTAEVPGVPGATMVAGTRVHGADCSDADQLTRAEIEGRRQVRAICDILRTNLSGGDAVGLAALPARLGIRESRHAECLHTLTEAEVLGGKRFPDAIANGTYRVDIHYPDHLMPIAGGFHFAEPGQSVLLDGGRSQARPGEEIATYEWRLHDGTCTRDATVPVPFEVPGLYSEELIVRTKSGAEARDYAQVRVYDRKRGRNMVTGWVYHDPVRGITPGQPVTFWNRLSGTRSDVRVDFGDGTPAATVTESTTHSLGRSGIFTVSFTTSGPDEEVASAQMCVVVELTDAWQGRTGRWQQMPSPSSTRRSIAVATE
jgi:hypothetical protein